MSSGVASHAIKPAEIFDAAESTSSLLVGVALLSSLLDTPPVIDLRRALMPRETIEARRGFSGVDIR